MFGLVLALAVAAQAATAAPLGRIHLADDDTPSDMPMDMPTDMPVDMPTDMSTDIPTATPSPTVTPTATVTATVTPTPIPIPILVQQVIQHGNDEQVQAINTRNLSLISDTVTADHLTELTGILQDMLNSHVTSIALLKLDWGPIVVAADGRSVVATTYETWRIVSQSGQIDYDPVRNDYTLVLDNAAAWKIKSDVQINTPPQRTSSGFPSL